MNQHAFERQNGIWFRLNGGWYDENWGQSRIVVLRACEQQQPKPGHEKYITVLLFVLEMLAPASRFPRKWFPGIRWPNWFALCARKLSVVLHRWTFCLFSRLARYCSFSLCLTYFRENSIWVLLNSNSILTLLRKTRKIFLRKNACGCQLNWELDSRGISRNFVFEIAFWILSGTNLREWAALLFNLCEVSLIFRFSSLYPKAVSKSVTNQGNVLVFHSKRANHISLELFAQYQAPT